MVAGSESIVKTLTEFGKLGVLALRTDVEPHSATRETVNSIRFEIGIENDGTIILRFLARAYFKALETGRGPRKSGQYQEFDLNLEEYLKARGLAQKKSKSGRIYFKMGESWVSAKSLAYLINKEGDSVFKKGGRIVYSPTLSKLAEEIKRAIISDYPKFLIRQILQR